MALPADARRDLVTLFYGEHRADRFVLTPEDSHHAIRVLRHQSGDRIWCIDGSGTAFEVELDRLDPREASGLVTAQKRSFHEPVFHIELLCGMAQPARMDWVIEKATELGVHEIFPILGATAPGPGRLRRWSRIARGASKQCQRGVVPRIHGLAPLEEHLTSLQAGGTRIWAERGGGTHLTLPRHGRVVLAVGHDSGFSDHDKQRLREAGFLPVGLGERRLRTETAVVVALSYLSGEVAMAFSGPEIP